MGVSRSLSSSHKCDEGEHSITIVALSLSSACSLIVLMEAESELVNYNKSAYVALLCLIAFIVVISICVVKQFIWDPLLAEHYERLRPMLSAAYRNISSLFYWRRSTGHSDRLLDKSYSDMRLFANDSSAPPAAQVGLPKDNQKVANSYGSSSVSPYAYTNFGSEE